MSLREEVTKLRTEFLKTQTAQEAKDRIPLIEAANKYLNELADHLVDAIKEKVKNNDIKEWTITSRHAESELSGSVAVFNDEALEKLTPAEIQKTSGYARLNEVCAKPEVDMCLGVPDLYMAAFHSGGVEIYIERPYVESRDAAENRHGNPVPGTLAHYLWLKRQGGP